LLTASTSLPGFGPLALQGGHADHKKEALSFLRSNSSLLGNLSTISWQDSSVQFGSELETHRINKKWKGLEVLGGEALVHLVKGELAFASADETSLDQLSATPLLSASDAEKVAFSSYRGNALRASNPELKVLVLGRTGEKEARLVYKVTVNDFDAVSSDIHFIDANNGQEAMVTSNVQTLASRKVLSGTGAKDDMTTVTDVNAEQLIDEKFKLLYTDSGCPSAGSPVLTGTSVCNSLAPDVMSSALSAWNNSGKVLEYFTDAHQRSSFDGAGGQVRSVVNFGGAGFLNAAWYSDRRIMLYGMGDGTNYNDFASSLDVVAHEITHGITSNTAGLIYSSESGALNESYSDVFGKLVQFRTGSGRDWKIGRDLFRDGVSFLRDMENPEVAHTKKLQIPKSNLHSFQRFLWGAQQLRHSK